jgi:hypothetical protein
MEQETHRFRAVSDKGEEFLVIEYENITAHKDLSGRTSTTRGLKRFALSDGSTVIQLDPETFKILQTDKRIRKIR